jgi:NADH-quinone oxidoreductase subunit H
MTYFLVAIAKGAVVAVFLLTVLAYLQWIERKLIAHIQLRLGPSRVGPHGLLQPLADVIKLITKEDLLPPEVNKVVYILAPFLAVATALVSVSVIPFGDHFEIGNFRTTMQLTDLNIGVLFIIAVSSLGVYAIALGGWASNNKYSLIGALRSSAQMISYELPVSLALAAPLLMLNTLSFREIVEQQAGFQWGFLPNWSILRMPFPQLLSFLIFLTAGFAETNRIPFDLPEAENELVAGYHTEYSSMKFAAFFMAEYANMITVAGVTTTVFLGGWQPLFPLTLGSALVPTVLFGIAGAVALYHGLHPARKLDRITLPVFAFVFLGVAAAFLLPWVRANFLPVFWFNLKTGFLFFLFVWVRGTLPRFRYDQLMAFAWKRLFPLAMANLLITGLLVALWG